MNGWFWIHGRTLDIQISTGTIGEQVEGRRNGRKIKYKNKTLVWQKVKMRKKVKTLISLTHNNNPY